MDEVGNGRANREDDVLRTKRAFGALGRYQEAEDGANGFVDRPLDTAIRGSQRDKGLRVDGFMRPAGPTERSLQDDVLGALRQENDRFGRDRDNGLDRSRPRSLFPAASLLDERGSVLDRLDLGRDRGGSFALVDLGKQAASASRAGDSRPGRNDTASDDRLSQQGSDRLASRSGDTRPDGGERAVEVQRLAVNTAAEAAPEEPEPARLKPALDKMENNIRRTVRGWREQGMTDAASHLEHFLKGSGEPITYNRDRARSFGPVRNAEQGAQAVIREQILKKARELEDGESFTGKLEPKERGEHGVISHGLNLLRGLLGDRDRLNDDLATGMTLVRPTFEGAISRDGDKIVVDGAVQYDWKDRYDFHPPQPGAAAAVSLEKYRGAKRFEFGGTWSQRLKGAIERRHERLLPNLSFSDVD